MSAVKTICTTCEYQNKVTKAVALCHECNEGFCQNCGRYHASLKATRHHRVSSIESINAILDNEEPFCNSHCKNITFFCSIHDEEICAECVESKHEQCEGVLSIQEATLRFHSSPRFLKFEDDLKAMITNTDKCLEGAQTIGNTLDSDRLRILLKIKEIKRKNLVYLDRMESACTRDLDSKYKEAKSEFESMKAEMEDKKKNLNEINDCLTLIKSSSSSHMFRAMTQIQKKLDKEKTRKTTDFAKEITIKMQGFDTISTEHQLCSFGNISIEKNKFKESETTGTPKESHDSIKEGTLKVNLKQHKTFDLVNSGSKKPKVGTCKILTDGKYVVLDHNNRRIIFQTDKEKFNEMKFEGFPCDIEILDKTRFAISYFDGNINIYDIQSFKLLHSITTGAWGSNGLAYNNDYLYAAFGDELIRRTHVDITYSKTVEKIHIESENPVYRLAVDTNKIYYHDLTLLYCSDISGQLLWVHRHDDFTELNEILYDGMDKVYVCDALAGVYVMSTDGKSYKCLIEKDEEMSPKHINYNQETKQLLVNLSCSKEFRLYYVS